MSKLIWFIFVVSIASQFDKSEQAYAVGSVLEDKKGQLGSDWTSQDDLRILNEFDEKFEIKHTYHKKIPEWTEMRQENNTEKLDNLCVLTWNLLPVQNYVRVCFADPKPKQTYGGRLLVTTGGEHRIDVLLCQCEHVRQGSSPAGQKHPFFITPLDETRYFKMQIRNMLDNGRECYRIIDIMYNVPTFDIISTEANYYDV